MPNINSTIAEGLCRLQSESKASTGAGLNDNDENVVDWAKILHTKALYAVTMFLCVFTSMR